MKFRQSLLTKLHLIYQSIPLEVKSLEFIVKGEILVYKLCMISIVARLSLVLSFAFSLQAFAEITTYTPTMESCGSAQATVIRRFREDGKDKALVVDPQTLKTQILDARELQQCGLLTPEFSQTAYGRLLKEARESDGLRANSGVTHSPKSSALFLTIDLCPSSHAYEQAFFNWIGVNKVPVAISISGGWINHHAGELAVLKALPTEIVWVNHTLTHPYDRHLPDEHNFLLLPGVDVTNEVLGNEKKMIENGLTPSIYLRFPGLISDRSINDQVNSWGLVALGADAWLAKGEKAKPGSIILVHGNGNEAPGIHRFNENAARFLKLGFDSLMNFIRE